MTAHLSAALDQLTTEGQIGAERSGAVRQLINGDRTMGALGIWVHVSAPLGHVGHAIRWTLEIRAARPVRVYPFMTFGKIVFMETYGDSDSYQRTAAKYARTDGIDISRLHEEILVSAKNGDRRVKRR